MRNKHALLRACLLACVPSASFAQVPVIVEAESGTLGASLTIATDAGGVTHITTTENSAVNPTPARTATYEVLFPAAGSYALYVRILTGPVGGNDDSFYVPNGFDTTTSWAAPYNTSTGGATAPGAGVPTGGTAGQNVWKWVRMTALPGAGGGTGPSAWVVTEGALTRTFAWGSREDGLLFDKFAFGPVGSCYTVGDLDAGRAPTVSCPPPGPPDPPAFTRTGLPLATGQPKFLGSAHSPGNASLNFGAYWNQVTPENGGKWGTAQPQSPFGPADQGYPTLPNPAFNFAQARQAYDQARANGHVFKWHVLFWGTSSPAGSRACPSPSRKKPSASGWARSRGSFPTSSRSRS
jgi:endo-1,4-beta-xylanase